MILRLDEIFVSGGSAQVLRQTVLDMLLTLPDMVGAWIGRPDDHGRMRAENWAGVDFGSLLASDGYAVSINQKATSNGPVGRAWRSNDIQIVNDWAADEAVTPWRAMGAQLGWRAAAAVPLRSQNKHNSVLALYAATPGYFSSPLLQAVITQMASSLGLAIAEREKNAALSRVQLLYQALFKGSEALMSARTEAGALRGICRRLVQSGLFVAASIGQPDKLGFLRYDLATAGVGSKPASALVQHVDAVGPELLLGVRAWRTRRLVLTNDYTNDPTLLPWRHYFKDDNWQASAAMPIRRSGKLWAVLLVAADQRDVFDDTLIELVERLGLLIGRALDEMDLKTRLQAERESQSQLARLDALTGLPNRLALGEYMPQAMARTMRHDQSMAISVLDIDDFKLVNDRHGHAAGDAVLREVATRLRATLRNADFVARLGGDEFALILEDLNWSHDLHGFCRRLGAALAPPVMLPDGQEFKVNVSLGLTLYPADQAPLDTLLRHADMALYESKSQKTDRNRFWCVYQDMIDVAPELNRGRALFAEGGLCVHYQPIIHLLSGAVVGVEALARLRDGPKLLPPAKFLPDFTIDDRKELSKQVLLQGLADLAIWEKAGHKLDLSVNIDAPTLLHDDTLTCFDEAIRTTGMDPRRITAEILETYEFRNLGEARERLTALRARGVRVALDDLGTGHSTILNMRDLPIDIVKLDKSFVRDLHRRPDDLMFVSVLRNLTSWLDIQLVVEGVETPEILDAMRMLSVGRVQGFEIARPMDRKSLTKWLDQHKAVPIRREPRTLLGAYTLQMSWMRAFQFQPTRDAFLRHLKSTDPFNLDQFFIDHNLRSDPIGMAYAHMRQLITAGAAHQTIWEAAQTLRRLFCASLAAQSSSDPPRS